PARGIEIDVDLFLEPFLQKRRALVVNATASHIERLDLLRGRISDRLEIAFADKKVILDHAAERRQRKHDLAVRFAGLQPDTENETVLFKTKHEPVRTAQRAARRETVALEQIVNGDL